MNALQARTQVSPEDRVQPHQIPAILAEVRAKLNGEGSTQTPFTVGGVRHVARRTVKPLVAKARTRAEDPAFVARVRELAAEGLGTREIARKLNCAQRTLVQVGRAHDITYHARATRRYRLQPGAPTHSPLADEGRAG